MLIRGIFEKEFFSVSLNVSLYISMVCLANDSIMEILLFSRLIAVTKTLLQITKAPTVTTWRRMHPTRIGRSGLLFEVSTLHCTRNYRKTRLLN